MLQQETSSQVDNKNKEANLVELLLSPILLIQHCNHCLYLLKHKRVLLGSFHNILLRTIRNKTPVDKHVRDHFLHLLVTGSHKHGLTFHKQSFGRLTLSFQT
jgi:hypothetical protein